MSRRLGGLFATALLALLLAACATASGGSGLTVFAAASLGPLMDELETAWLVEHPDLPLTISTGASSLLAAQISEGAEPDVFMSADTLRPDELSAAGLTASAPRLLAHNRVVLVAPAADARVAAPADLADPGTRIIGTVAASPIAAYATSTIEALADTMPDPAAFAAAVEANVVSHEDNVRTTLAKVELGEGDAGFVYRTDALASSAVRNVPLPAGVGALADYGVVQVSDRADAAAFVDWLATPAAATILQRAGFEVDT
jgi:molybdate transport system substrate-binding protein